MSFFLLPLLLLQTDLQTGGKWEVRSTALSSESGPQFSISMDSLGDVDGDGHQDLIIGAPASKWFGRGFGAAHVYSGATGVRLYSVSANMINSAYGVVVSRAGDLDRDGYEDFLVGAHEASFSGSAEGAVFVYSGIDGHLLTVVPGIPGSSSGVMGNALSKFGDFDLDGHDDFLVGDSSTSILPGSFGFGWLISGRDYSILHTFAEVGWYGTCARVLGISDLTGDDRPEILMRVGFDVLVLSGADFSVIRTHVNPGPQDNNFGVALAELGDVDQDGVSDYVIGAPAVANPQGIGSAYVYSGATGNQLAVLYGNFEVRDEFGASCAGPGDVDGDGFPDILIGALGETAGLNDVSGAAHLFSGYDFHRIQVFKSQQPRLIRAGFSVTGAGDLNGDGLMEFRIGSFSSHHNLISAGVVRTYGLQSFLQPSARSVSAAAGGSVDFALDFPDRAGSLRYAILASTGAGRTKLRGERVPLGATPLLEIFLRAPPAVFAGVRGSLDAAGDAFATLTLAPSAADPWIGRTLKFSAVVLDAAGRVEGYSAAMPLVIEP